MIKKFKVIWEQWDDTSSSPLQAAKTAAFDICSGNTPIYTVKDLNTNEEFIVDISKDLVTKIKGGTNDY